ncbi:MAG TPA: AMP-binding protein [Dermatophilaceae bacterium]|nr:AMP-binding protein [Dermatophilaceae bacterium]
MSDLLAGLTSGHHPDQHVTVAGVTLTYAALLPRVRALAFAVQESGAERVAVHATPTWSTVLGVTAAVVAGVTVVPVPADAGPGERAHILRDSAATHWLGELPPDGPSGLGHLPVELPADSGGGGDSEGGEGGEGASATAYSERGGTAYPLVDDASPCFILYTSGTTGLPKGVVLSQRAVAAGLDALADAWAWTARDVLAHGLPLFHVHGLVLGVLGPLRLGSGLHHVGRPTPEAYAAAVTDGATMCFGVPTIWSRIAATPDAARSLGAARLLVSGSAALPVPVFERLRELTGLEVCERYGMTETLITVATRADGVRRAGAVGVPVAGVETRVRGDDGGEVAHDGESVGDLQVRGATLFDGYLGREAETLAAFTPDGWFRTGDVATIDPAGVHRIVGRASVDLIKSGGYRIGAGEIEGVLLSHAAVAECAVVGVPDPDLGQRIVAHVVRSEGGAPGLSDDALATELVDLVIRELSIHKRPREVRFVAALPRNEMGKVQKTRLL